MRFALIMTLVICLTGLASGQTPVVGTVFTQYMANQPSVNSIGMSSPIPASSITDAIINLNVRGAASTTGMPVAMLYDSGPVPANTINIDAWNMFNIQIDIRDKGADGYGNQVLFSGYTNPNAETVTQPNGELTATTFLPACISVGANFNCITNVNFTVFGVSSQAIVFDFTNPPFNLKTTAAILGTFDNGYQEFMLDDSTPGVGEDFGVFNFKQGFVFRYYGQNFTSAFVSSNGFVSFGQAGTTFPNPSVGNVASGVPRIMSFFNDLVPQQLSNGGLGPGPAYPSTRIYAQQFQDANGLTKIKFVHDMLAEFDDQTGPHGGEIVITDNDDIAVFVGGYNSLPSINTAVGITPGNNVDNNVQNFGVDLSALHGTLAVRGPGKAAFELFDHGNGSTAMNTLDLAGFANNLAHPVGRGVVFLKDVTALNTAPGNSSYVVQ